ncbi:hypothetical protein [Methylopila sp. M107]|uniref:hypothetical protein n=1 Tax=Methylopila sp. M107 TaxID=1101190 RepID=UPI0003A15B4D|nr:hypothetical protein [Methylopila sp. M107]
MVRMLSLCSAAAIAAAFAMPAPAQALSMKECGAKYQAAKEANALKGQSWNDFRKAECAADDDAAAPAAPAPAAKPKPTAATAAEPSAGGLTMKECGAKYQAAKDANTLKGKSWNEFRKAECAAGDDVAAPAAPTPAPKPTAATTAAPSSGGGLTMKECGAKYQAAKAANTLNGQKWNEFRKAECFDDDASEAEAAAAEKAVEPAAKPTAGQKTPPASTTAETPKKPVVAGKAAFPSDVSPKYADESAGRARMHTCLDQYRANKAANVDQPNWIEKGGGYYSQCNTKLKEGA